MIRDQGKEIRIALLLIAPFVAVYGLVFVYPIIDMFILSFQKAPLIGQGKFIGLDNYTRLSSDRRFNTALLNTTYFVLLSVVPGTLVALLIALGIRRLKGRMQAFILALFFLPYILPVSVVYRIWDWTLNFQFGIGMRVFDWIGIERIPIFKQTIWFMPAVAGITIWWTAGFSILLFLAGLRAIPQEIYEAAALDNASGWRTFRHITWILLWPVTALVLTIQLILQLKIFDQVYLFSQGGRPNDNLVMVYYIFNRAFVSNQGGRAAAIAVVLLLIILIASVLNYQIMRFSEHRK